MHTHAWAASPSSSPSLLMSSSSPIDSLPLDTLVQVVCKLSHDELKPLLTVSKSFHNAALAARHSHFDFSTPQRSETSAFDRAKGTERAPSVPLVRSRKPRVPKLCEEETQRVATVLFPTGDRERRLGFKSAGRACSLATDRKGLVVRVSNAYAHVRFRKLNQEEIVCEFQPP